MSLLFLCKAAALLQVGTGAEAAIDSTGNDDSTSGTSLAPGEGAVQLLAIGAILGVDGINLVAQRGEQRLGDGVAGARAVELEHADVARRGGGNVGHADERLRRGGEEARSRGAGGQNDAG